jgi:hypothetical protein
VVKFKPSVPLGKALRIIRVTNDNGYAALIVMIQSTISLEMPVPSQGHYGFHSFPVVD